MQLLTTHHVSFTVADMDRSLHFWRDLLGLRVQFDWISDAGYLAEITGFPGVRLRLVYLHLPDTAVRLELMQYLNPAGAPRPLPTNVPGAAHICFDVPDVEAAYRELSAAGVTFRSPPVLITSEANYGARAVYLEDPDGITLELRQAAPA